MGAMQGKERRVLDEVGSKRCLTEETGN